MKPQHIIHVEVGLLTKEQADAFLAHLYGSNDVLGKMEEGIFIATGERPHVNISALDEDYLNEITSVDEAWL